MATEVARRQLILAYDGDCPMCLAIVAALARSRLVPAEQLKSNHYLAPDELERATSGGIRNQLVVLDPESSETRAGVDGLLWLVGENRGYPLWVRALSLMGVRQVVGQLYQTIAYNRRVITPPRHRIRCDCEPEVTLGRRLMLLVPLAALAVASFALFGAATFAGGPWGGAAAGVFVAIGGGSAGWIAMLLGAAVLLRGEQRSEYLAHLVVTAVAAALVLVPAGVVGWWLPATARVAVAGASVLASLLLVFRMLRKRATAVGLGAAWAWGATTAVGIGWAAGTFVCLWLSGN